MSKLLALDLSSNIGWAMFDPSAERDRRVRFGTLAYDGPRELPVDRPRLCGRFSDWLNDMFMVDPWDAMAWEEPFLAPHDKVDKIKILIGLVGQCNGFVGSRHHPMPSVEIPPKAVKKRMTDRQDADKADVIRACWSVGWKVRNDHEADACGVGLCAYRQIWPVRAAA